MTKHGSREHFQQVIDAHTLSPSGNYCRCGATVFSYREHIANVWLPYSLPANFMSEGN